MASSQRIRRVAVLGLGGTISMTRSGGGGVVPALSTAQLLDSVPGLSDTGIEVEAVDFRRLPGPSLGFDDLAALASEVRARCAAGVDGVVITQGTDTIEETSFYLDLRHTAEQPVVVTGAMRNPASAGADGPGNLLAAVQTAVHPSARNLGCLVVFADEVHAAHRVRKTHTTSGATFVSANGGPLGYVVEGLPRLVNRLSHREVLTAPGSEVPVRVGVVTATLGDDGVVLDRLAGLVDGLVIAAFGAGHVPVAWVEPLERLAATIPVVLASRTGAGSVLSTTYGYPGSERDLLARGLVPAGFLDPVKARILLHGLLATGAPEQRVRAAFAAMSGLPTVGDEQLATPVA